MTREDLINAIVEDGYYTRDDLSYLSDEWLWFIATGIDE